MTGHRFAVSGIPETEDAAKRFVESLDRQIAELDNELGKLKTVRGSVARIFGIDRPAQASKMESLLAGANRSMNEASDAELEHELSVALGGK